MVVPAVFQSTRYRRRCNSVARSLAHSLTTEPILKHRGVFRGVFAGGVAAGRTRRALAQLQPINEQVSDTDGVARVVVYGRERITCAES
jgi:hypothetical protein